MLTSSEIEQRRSPVALRAFVNKLKNTVGADEAERNRGTLKEELYKEFLDEIVPLSLFSLQAYPENYRIQPVIGSQGYDALVFDETDKEVDRVEMTVPHDGAAQARDARLAVERGFGQVKIGKPGDDFEVLIPIVLTVCKQKAEKDYSDCTLVVAIEPLTFKLFEPKYESQIASLVAGMKQIEFKAKRVFLLVMPNRIFEV